MNLKHPSSEKSLKVMLLHGYGLVGSGSNLYVHRISEILPLRVAELHVVCQEHSAHLPEHIDRVIDYDASGNVVDDRTLVAEGHISGNHGGSDSKNKNKNKSHKAQLILHRPSLGPVLPVYNWDVYPGFDLVKTFLDLNDFELEDYLQRHAKAVGSIVRNHHVDIIHANHVLAMPEVARRAVQQTNCRVIVTPHGSALEYIARKDEKYAKLGHVGLAAADHILVGGSEMTERLADFYGEDLVVEDRVSVAPMGVDIGLFRPDAHIGSSNDTDAKENTACHQLHEEDGAGRQEMAAFFDAVQAAMPAQGDAAAEDAEILRLAGAHRETYNRRVHDRDAAKTLGEDLGKDARVAVFAGKLVAGKGVHALLLAATQVKNCHLWIVGEGPFREPLELLWRSIVGKDFRIFSSVLRLGPAFEHKPVEALHHLKAWQSQEAFEHLCRCADANDFGKRVHFLGYMPHQNLAPVIARADITVLPSTVPEAYPLALAESLAVGIPPLATNVGGARRFFDELLPRLPDMHRRLRVDPRPEALVDDLARALGERMAMPKGPVAEARKVAEETYGWESIVTKIVAIYAKVVAQKPNKGALCG